MPFSFEMIAATDIGLVRAVNEDSLRIMPEINLAVVADGMGGHKAGDIASRMAVSALCDHFEEQTKINDAVGYDNSDSTMADAFALANSQVYANAHQVSECEGMGTTLIASLFTPESIHIGHIGDSRAYRFSQGELRQLTTDHTLAAELSVDTPDWDLPAYSHHVLRKALGIESRCEPDFIALEPENKQIYLLCSDGLTGVLTDRQITTILALKSHQPEHCLEQMIEACINGGAPDNISIVLIYTRKYNS